MTTVLKSETPTSRLFSNLELDGNKLNHQPGSVLGSTALIAGTTIGAGILALPAVTLPSGVVPSTALLIAVWIYTLISGYLLVQVTLNTMSSVGLPSLGLLVIIESTLGKLVARIAGGAYLFMHYVMLVAYIAQGGSILVSAVEKMWGVHNVLPAWVGTTAFTVLFGGIMYLGRDRFIAKLNNAFVAIVIASFIGLLFLGSTQVQPSKLSFQNWSALPAAVSVMFVALFFHTIIPVITVQLEGDIRKIRQSIVIGSGIPLIMFLAWNAVILGSVSPDVIQGISTGKTVFDPLQTLRDGGAGEWLGVLVSVFSEFALVTSFIGFVYGLLDFFRDISPVSAKEPLNRLPLYSLILFPPLSLSTLNPSIFFAALDYAGTFSISVLGGIIPAVISWKQTQEQEQLNSTTQSLVPGGKITLIIMIGVALIIMIRQVIYISGLT
ncbi:MAG: aromatic amino acid transport family protein [Rhizonema sp. PD38]|nr:aromatic amino acid transport family protein [Rhizonema sp. PD38]